MEQEVPSAGVRKEGVGVEGESAEGSVVEDGEEVGSEVQYAARVGELTAALQVYSKMAMRVLGGEEEEEEEGDVVSESDDVSCGGRIDLADESGEFFFFFFFPSSLICLACVLYISLLCGL
jgi:hypothetical protein